MRRAVLEVDLEAVRNNAKALREMAGSSFFCPMVKADAYGHGAAPVTKALWEAGVKQAGVVSLDEAEPIRKACPDMGLLIFGPVSSKEDFAWIAQESATLVCCDWPSLKALAQLGKPATIHLEFDTGFSRLGFPVESAPQLLSFLKDNSHIQCAGLSSHLISGDRLADQKSLSFQQLKAFLQLKKTLSHKGALHLLNSEALICQYVNEGDCGLGARPGISLYGVKPKVFCKDKKAEQKWKGLSLLCASSLKSQIVAVRDVAKGSAVSYGAHWRADKKTKIATVSLGYADGFPRALGAKREVLFRGKRRPIVGAVCMDFFMIQLEEGDQPVQLGEEIVIFNSELSPMEQSQSAGSIPYELFCSLGSRAERVYKSK